MTTKLAPSKVARAARLSWVPIADMKVNPLAQREQQQARIDHLVANFELEQMGTPTVSKRGGSFFIIDGQHRIEALRALGFGDEKVQCWTYEGLTESDEAEMFLKLNDTLAVAALPKYRSAITAGRPIECDIDRVVRSLGLVVTLDNQPGAIGAVGTLRRVYVRSGPGVLARSLAMIRDAYGDPGFDAAVIDGISLLCQRYNGDLNDAEATKKLAAAHGGANGLLGKATSLKLRTGGAKAHCVAATAVDIINTGRGGKKLPSWWKVDA